MTREVVRRYVRDKLRRVEAQHRSTAAAAIAERVMRTAAWRSAQSVLLFASLPTEVNTDATIAGAFAEGKEVYLPRLSPQADSTTPGMRFYRYREGDALDDRPHGIREPSATRQPWAPETSAGQSVAPRSLVVCPGLAFDRFGHRLGRGGGYYDRFLAAHRASVTAIGVCYSIQLLDLVPVGPDDEPVEIVITETQTLHATDAFAGDARQ